jgi:GST-like protein
MLELYTAGTHNGMRAHIALAESGLDYVVRKIDLSAGEQRGTAFLGINPAGRIPALIDPDGPGEPTHLSQSIAIMMYVAGKSGRMWPAGDAGRIAALQWLMFAGTDATPWASVYFHATQMMPQKAEANIEYCRQRLLRWFGEADAQLGRTEYLAGEISLADYALFPVIDQRLSLADEAGLTHLRRWWSEVRTRPGVRRAMREMEESD